MDKGRRERFWEVTCTLTPLLYFALVMVIALLVLSLVAVGLGPQAREAVVVSAVNVALSTALLVAVLSMIRKCRNVYN